MPSSGRAQAGDPTNGGRCASLERQWLDASLAYHKAFLQSAGFDLDLQAISEATALAYPALFFGEADAGVRFGAAHAHQPTKTLSTISCDTQTTSSAGPLLSPVQSEGSDALTVRSCWSRGPSPLCQTSINSDSPQPLVCLGPQCNDAFSCEADMETHVKAIHTHTCNWAGCHQPSFASRDGLIWHVQAEHLLICPYPGCTETSSQSIRVLRSHIAVAHPDSGKHGIKEWQLSPKVLSSSLAMQRASPSQSREAATAKADHVKEDPLTKDIASVNTSKRKCQDKLRNVVEKKAKKSAGTLRSAESPTDLVRNKASRVIDTASFPLVFEHAILPFLAEFVPRWCGPRHAISVTRGMTPQMKRLCVMTTQQVSRARQIIIAKHVTDLLPDKFRPLVTFVFCVGQVNRTTWARGLGKSHPDDLCAPRNPYFFQTPCMGDSIGIQGSDSFDDSTATLGPCLNIGGGSFWLGNFHPFLEAYQSVGRIEIEHPSPEDRKRCIEEAHDAMAQDQDFKIGDLEVTSGLNLKTTRLSHDPFWEECDQEKPLVVMDWALIGSRQSHANMLRRFPSETQPILKEPMVTSAAAIVPGASVISSGRTSGYQRGQVCEIPAYVSGDMNGTQKATREWFVEEPYPYDNEEAWIRGGIGVEGDSGAAIIDADTGGLVGQLWGRNRYWGPGPRQTFFTPIADIFDDIQEKCGQQTRPRLPQYRDEAECYPMYPSCRQCYDLRTYQDSRRSSRMSLQSMIMGRGDADQDLTSIEAVSELATPLDNRFLGIEETGSSFHDVLSPASLPHLYPGTPVIAESRSPYAPTLDLTDVYHAPFPAAEGSRKRAAMPSIGSIMDDAKRHKVDKWREEELAHCN